MEQDGGQENLDKQSLQRFLHDAMRKGVKYGDCGRMCDDCAFKLGSDANNDEAALVAIETQLLSGGGFNCHTPEFTDAGRPCVGYLYAMQHFDYLDKQ